jgi:peptidoglycan/xylan/chitin deacetylase (PgdA/CDA1 family)
LTPRDGWTLSGVAANWFRLYNITGNDAANTLTHAAGANVLTKTFAATTPVLPYPNPTQFIVIGIDDTLSPETNDLLDVLEANNIKANFFTIGMNLEKATRKPEYARALDRLKSAVYEPGNHTWQHERWTRTTTEIRLADWTKTQDYMNELFGKKPTWIRFPYNDQNASAVADASTLGLSNLWGFDTNDWDITRSASYLINRVLSQTSANNMARDGQIYVHHDHYDNQNSTRYALPEIAHYLRSRGIDYMTASELSRRNNVTPVPGTTYNNFFLPSRVTIGTQPAASTTLTEGDITGSLTVAATVTPTATPTYQWYSASFGGNRAINGETGASFTIPTTLAAGTYYYYCVASAANAASVTSNVVTVTVAPELPILFENGQWAAELGEITTHTPGGASTLAYENGLIKITNGVPTSKNVAFRFIFENLVDMRGYDAVVMELEEAPVGWFGGIVRFRIDQDACLAGEGQGNVIRMASGTSVNVGGMVGMSAANWDLERLRGVGGLPAYGESVKIKKVYLEGDGDYEPVTISADARNIMDVIPPRTGNTPVTSVTTSSQYAGAVQWSPNHTTFQADTVYTATITLTPKTGWKLDGVPQDWFRIYYPTGGAVQVTHEAGSGVLTHTFPATKAIVPYPEPTQFVALSFDDVYLSDTEALVDALDQLGIKGTFFANGINIEKSRTNPDYKRALDKLIAGGHELATHLWQHERYDNTADEDVTRENFKKNQDLIFEFAGKSTQWSRIPYASHGTMSLRVAGEFGLTNLRGLATNDWDFPNSVSRLVNTVITATGNNSVRDGQIYVCHNQPGQTNTVQALPEYFHELRSRGVGFMTISELRAHRNFAASPGVNYANFFQNSATPQIITINTQPTAPPAENLVHGNISGSLTVAATAAQSAVLTYQWYSADSVGGWTVVDGATSATFAVPTNLTAGTYYFYCKLSASNAPSKTSDVVAVTVS